MRKTFIITALIEIIICIIILNYYPESVYITPLYYTITASIFILTLILALTYYAEYCVLRKLHSKMKYYIYTYKDSKDEEHLVLKDMRTHKAIYNKQVDYINPNLIESLILQVHPILPMNDYLQFVSEDFKLSVPKTCTDIPGYLLSYINQPYTTDRYIYDTHGDTWIRFINVQNPQDTITFTQNPQN